MQSLYSATAVDVAFDDPNLIADGGLVALAEQVGLPELVAEHLAIVDADNSAGANPCAKVMSLVRTRSRTWTAAPAASPCTYPRAGPAGRLGRTSPRRPPTTGSVLGQHLAYPEFRRQAGRSTSQAGT